ncbi:hypothetical protein GOBAR_AA34526 [Gossypium barbadense]|uniref:Uncharacterized protein n=1 Tax=Gossypium barbadense TaxID=3634 RepID=A0A2P5W522_GOSBA|nr:hypothetical protein GOBAR_AA34526 [Gossypium barbadense]
MSHGRGDLSYPVFWGNHVLLLHGRIAGSWHFPLFGYSLRHARVLGSSNFLLLLRSSFKNFAELGICEKTSMKGAVVYKWF